MMGQYLSNTNESASIPILQKFFEVRPCLVGKILGFWLL
jgi:hypothetical protein